MAKRAERGKAYYMISAVSQKYNIHPQTLRLYEREGLLKPSRTEGNTRLYSEEDLEQLETILALTRDLGVNLAGVEIILNMRRKIEQMQGEVNEFMDYVKRELARGIDDWEQRLNTALVKSSPTDLGTGTQTEQRQKSKRQKVRSQKASSEVRKFVRLCVSHFSVTIRSCPARSATTPAWKTIEVDGVSRVDALRLRARVDGGAAARATRASRAAISTATRQLHRLQRAAHQGAAARGAPGRGFPGRRQRLVPAGPAGRRQDAPRGGRAAAGDHAHAARAASSTTRAICSA